MNIQTETLRLADSLTEIMPRAAAELRRLHEANIQLAIKVVDSKHDVIILKSRNQSLVEALYEIAYLTRNIGSAHIIADAALTKARGAANG